MKPLLVLLAVFMISLLVIRSLSGRFDYKCAGNIALAAMLVFTAIGHFVFTKGMAMMLPTFIPYKTALVYLTGLFEIAAAIGLLIPSFRTTTAWLLILFFLLVLPANIYAAMNHIDYQNATFDGKGLSYLWFRIPLQLVFIAWVYWASINNGLKIINE